MIFEQLFPEPIKRKDLRAATKRPQIKNLKECKKFLVENHLNVWYEYVPVSYDGKTAVPLVVHLHGGASDGKRYAEESGWHMVADKENFIVIYPNSIIFEHWECSDLEIEYLAGLIEHVCAKYHIDRTRIYMQGMSNGDMMTVCFAQAKGDILAAAGMLNGPSDAGFLQEPADKLPVIQMRGEKDMMNNRSLDGVEDPYQTRDVLNDINRLHWMNRNEASAMPVFMIRGKNNFVKYGGEAPVIFWEVKDVPHYEPVNSAQVFWDFLYSGARKSEGMVYVGKCRRDIVPDQEAFAFALGSNKVLKGESVITACEGNGKVLFIEPIAVGGMGTGGLDSDTFHSRELYAPVEMLEKMLDVDVEMDTANDVSVVTKKDGIKLIFQNGMELVCVDGECDALKKCCLSLCGAMYIPIIEVLESYFDLRVSVCDGVVYVSRHFAELAHGTARLMRQQLGGYIK